MTFVRKKHAKNVDEIDTWTKSDLKRLNHFKMQTYQKQKDKLTMAATNFSFTNNTITHTLSQTLS